MVLHKALQLFFHYTPENELNKQLGHHAPDYHEVHPETGETLHHPGEGLYYERLQHEMDIFWNEETIGLCIACVILGIGATMFYAVCRR